MIPHIDIAGAAEIVRAWDRAPEIVEAELTAALTEATLLLQREVQEATPVGVGGMLRASIAAREPRRVGNAVIGEVGTALAYAVPVELGTRPHFPPVAALVDWVKAKLGVAPGDSRRVAFLVARKIARHGTKGAHMFERAFAANRAQAARIVEAAHRRIRDRLASGAV